MIQRVEITKDLYDYINDDNIKDVAIQEAIRAYVHPAGYGCWCPFKYKKGDQYFLAWERLESCD